MSEPLILQQRKIGQKCKDYNKARLAASKGAGAGWKLAETIQLVPSNDNSQSRNIITSSRRPKLIFDCGNKRGVEIVKMHRRLINECDACVISKDGEKQKHGAFDRLRRHHKTNTFFVSEEFNLRSDKDDYFLCIFF